MANTEGPIGLRIRVYDVGFGDCFLLTFRYAAGAQRERHVLIDFGSTASAKGIPLGKVIAEDIAHTTDHHLDAVVVTHRHEDHISGFTTAKDGNGTGDVIRKCAKSALILQPWTDDPELATDATAPAKADSSGTGLQAAHVRSIAQMQQIAAAVVQHARRLDEGKIEQSPGVLSETPPPEQTVAAHAPGGRPASTASSGLVGSPKPEVGVRLREQLAFLGEKNLSNVVAIRNLNTIPQGKHRYLRYGANTGLEQILPGVRVDVLGPPTIADHKEILKERQVDQSEFWHLQASATNLTGRPRGSLFPRAKRETGKRPFNTRWFVRRLKGIHAQQLLELVRIVDDSLNNTSLILLFTIGDEKLLFPGDAQIENWEFALKVASDKTKNLADLRDVTVYKVGHHGSLNATPKTLWKNFSLKGRGLQTLLSTKPNKFGHTKSGTEVPRDSLVTELKKNSKLFATTDLAGTSKEYFVDVELKFQ
jgi:beta-lactamase superfamily II metal-dependent hydrolase